MMLEKSVAAHVKDDKVALRRVQGLEQESGVGHGMEQGQHTLAYSWFDPMESETQGDGKVLGFDRVSEESGWLSKGQTTIQISDDPPEEQDAGVCEMVTQQQQGADFSVADGPRDALGVVM